MLTDTSIVHRHAGYEVQAHRQLVTFSNGTTVGLHPVSFCGYTDRWLRATQHDDLHWVVVDLRRMTYAGFEADIKCAPERDADGLTLYALRASYPNATDFLAQALAKCRTAWFSDQPIPQAA